MLIESAIDIDRRLKIDGFVFVHGDQFKLDVEAGDAFEMFSKEWQNLPPDKYLKGQEPFRRRRYGRYSYSAISGQLKPLSHQPFYQSKQYNRFVGGIQRVLEPLTAESRDNLFLSELIKFNFKHLHIKAEGNRLSKVGVHQIRILSNSQFNGTPTPEGIHRDGVSYFSVHLIKRSNISEGGVTRIFSPAGKEINNFTLMAPLDSLYVDDSSIFHCVSEIVPDKNTENAYRDVLVATYE